MKKLFILLMTLLGYFALQAQRPIIIGTENEYQSGPICGYYGYERMVSIYTPNDGLAAGDILSIAWNKPSAVQSIPVKIYLKEVPSSVSTVDMNLSWNTFITGATMVYDATPTWTGGAEWVTIPLSTPFTYNGGNLMVMVASNVTGNGLKDVMWNYSSYGVDNNGFVRKDTGIDDDIIFSSFTTNGLNNQRPNIKFVIDLTNPNSCLIPLPIRAPVMGPNFADFTWERGNNETQWVVSYKQRTSTTWTESIVSDPSFSCLGLTTVTAYDFKVKAKCGTGDADTSLPRIISFTTSCAASSAFPVIENFETTNAGLSSVPNAPDCWSFLKTYSGAYTYVASSATNALTGTKYYYLYHTSTLPAVHETMLVSPYLENLDTLRVRFFAKYSAAGQKLRVGYMGNPKDVTTFTPVDSMTLTTTWTEYTSYFTNIMGRANYIAFSAKNPTTYNYVWLDSITIEVVPSCPMMLGLSVDNVTHDSIYVGIRATSSLLGYDYFDVEYRKVGDQSWSSTTTDTTLVRIGNLDPETEYEIRIKAICNNGTASADTLIIGKTAQIPVEIPFIENFEDTLNLTWKKANGTQINKWHAGSATYAGDDGSSFSAYITNDDGVSNVYTITTASITHMYRDVKFPQAEEFELSFDWKAEGQTTYDYLTVALVDPIIEPVAGTKITSGEIIPLLNQNGEWRKESILLPRTLSGQTKRLVFSWINNAGTGTQPPAAIDNVEINNSDCLSPVNLEATNVGVDTLNLTWTSTGTTFNVEYRETEGNSNWISELSSASSYTLGEQTPLQPNTLYDIRVQANCPNGQSFWTEIIQVRTKCLPPTLPLTEGFETSPIGSSANPQPPYCWSYLREGSIAYAYVYNTTASNIHSGTKSYYNYTSSASAQNMLISPAFSEDISTLQVKFWAFYNSTTAYKIRVGYITDPTDISTFYPIDTIETSNSWQQYTVDFNTAPSRVASHIAFNAKSTTTPAYNYVYLDDITIDKIPACTDTVKNIRAHSVTANTANIVWDSVSGSLGYDIAYKEVEATSWITQTVSTFPGQITGLLPGKRYEIMMRTHCIGGGTGEWFAGQNVVTDFALPFSQYFDGATIDGWYFTYTTGSPMKVYTTTATGTYVSSPKAVYLTNGAYVPGDLMFWRAPKIDTTIDLTTAQVRFKAKGSLPGLKLEVGVMNSDSITSFSCVDTILMTTEWNTYIVNLAGYTGNNHQIAFGHNTNPQNTDIYLDNIDIDYIPTPCQEVANIYVDSLTNSGFKLSWRNLQTSYIIEYEILGSNNIQTQSVSTNSYVFTSLPSNTTYKIRIKSECDPEFWSEYFQVTTLTEIAGLPFEENFENASEWLFLNGTQPNKWHIGNTEGVNCTEEGENGMYISDNNGDSNRYINASSRVYAVKLIRFDDNTTDYQIEYDWKNRGESINYDFIRVYMVPIYETNFPINAHPTAANWINLYGSSLFQAVDAPIWKHESRLFKVPEPGVYRLVFYWFNDGSGGKNPPAAIDNISIIAMPCSTPREITISNNTTTGVDVSFKVPYNAQNVSLIYKVDTATVWDTADMAITAYVEDSVYTYNLTGLHPASSYQLFMKGNCVEGDTSLNTVTYNFQTITPAPWVETFDSSSFFPSAMWERYSFLYTPTAVMNTSSITPATTGWLSGTIDGNKTAYINIFGASRSHWLMTPIIDLDTVRKFTLEFDVKLVKYNTNGSPIFDEDDKFVVLLSKDGGLTWDPADAVEWGNSSNATYSYKDLGPEWKTVQIPLTDDTGNVRIAFYGESTVTTTGADNNLHIDNIAVITCPKPADVKVENVKPTSADISWTHLSVTDFDLEYKADTASVWTTVPLTVTNYNLSSLQPNTNYVVRVKANCGDGLGSSFYSMENLFTTPCAATALPIIEGFETTATGSSTSPNAPDCWSYIRTNSSAYAYVSTTTPHLGGKDYYLYHSSTNPTSYETRLVSPYFAENIATLRARFWARYSTSGYNKLVVGYMNNPSNVFDFQVIDTIDLSANWTEYFIPFNVVDSGAGNYIAFNAKSETGANYVYLDNITIESIPACGDIFGISFMGLAPTSVNVAWTAVTSASAYDVQYRMLDPDSAWSSSITATANSYNIQGLQSMTSYEVRIRSKCNTTDTGAWSYPVSFSTPCIPTALPIAENFESTVVGSGSAPNAPDCWSFIKTYSYAYAYVSTSYSHSGGKAYYMYHSSTTPELYETMLISPYFTEDIATLRARFWARYGSSGANSLMVGYITNPMDVSSFHPVDTVTLLNAWTEYFVNLDQAPSGGANFIAFSAKSVSTGINYVYMDDITIEPIPACEDVFGIQVPYDSTTASSALVKWNTIEGISGYNVQYREEGSATWSNSVTLTVDSCKIEGLQSSTYYEVRVRSKCNTSDTGSWSYPVIFLTKCLSAVLPIVEDFETTPVGASAAPNAPLCWSYLKTYSSAYAYVSTSTPFEGGKCYYLYHSSTSPAANETMLISPYFAEDISTLRVKFWARYSSSVYRFRVGYMTNPVNASTFVPVDTIGVPTAWTEFDVRFNGVPSNAANYIAFDAKNSTGATYVYLDYITIEPIPSCEDVDSVVVRNIDLTAATVKWNLLESATAYDIQYRKSGTQTWSEIQTTTADSLRITGLQHSSIYEVHIRSKCNVSDTGVWTYPIAFSTPCGSLSLPFTENFAGTFPPLCWTRGTGLLPTDGTNVSLTTNTSWAQDDFAEITGPGSFKAARLNIYSTGIKHWLISPEIDLGSEGSLTLQFDLALTDYGNPAPPDPTGDDEKFIVLVSSDADWSINDTVAVWDNVNSPRVYDNISYTGEHISIPLTGHTGVVRIAFYGESTVSGGDNNLFVSNILIKEPCYPVTNVAVTTVGQKATVTWTAHEGQTQWKVRCDKEGGEQGTPVTTNTATYTFEGLERGERYTISVWAICDEIDVSDSTLSTPFTISRCDNVSDIQISTCASTAEISWIAVAGQEKWEWICTSANGGEPMSGNVVTQTSDVIRGLEPGTSYHLQIRPICGEGDTGEYSPQHLFTTVFCQGLDTVAIVHAPGEDSIYVSWNDTSCHVYWQVSVVPLNASPDESDLDSVGVSTGTWIKVGDENGQYTVYVRGVCEGGYYGDWKEKEAKLGIPSLDKISPKVTLAPNPTRGQTQLSIEGITGEVEMTLISLEGKVLRKEKLNCQARLSKEITLQGLSKGTYLIHLTHKNWTKVEKLIVQ